MPCASALTSAALVPLTCMQDPVGEHCSWRWLPPKRMRGGFGGMGECACLLLLLFLPGL